MVKTVAVNSGLGDMMSGARSQFNVPLDFTAHALGARNDASLTRVRVLVDQKRVLHLFMVAVFLAKSRLPPFRTPLYRHNPSAISQSAPSRSRLSSASSSTRRGLAPVFASAAKKACQLSVPLPGGQWRSA